MHTMQSNPMNTRYQKTKLKTEDEDEKKNKLKKNKRRCEQLKSTEVTVSKRKPYHK